MKLAQAGSWYLGQKITPEETVYSITMETDGNGISGFYDVIYIWTNLSKNRPYAVMPAHNVDFWIYNNED